MPPFALRASAPGAYWTGAVFIVETFASHSAASVCLICPRDGTIGLNAGGAKSSTADCLFTVDGVFHLMTDWVHRM